MIFLGLIGACLAFSQDYTGHYRVTSTMGAIEMILQNTEDQEYSGSLINNGRSFEVQGQIQNKWLTGTVSGHDEFYTFQAILMGERLSFSLSEANPATGQKGRSQTLVFEKSQTGAEKNTVRINNTTLDEKQLQEFEAMYGARPLPGNYWYDPNCGLYGVVGYPAYGFMFPGHDYGPLQQDVSNGNTGVFVNGRELPQLEWAVWSYMLGYWIQPGRYWLDQEGNAGYEGHPAALVNLFAAARQNAYYGQGGSGDNFWSTRFSAGNSNAANTQGYVSVPGYGPVGYGF